MSDSELKTMSLLNLQFAATFKSINSQDHLTDQGGAHTAEERRTEERRTGASWIPQTVSQTRETKIDPSQLLFEDSVQELSIFVFKKRIFTTRNKSDWGRRNEQLISRLEKRLLANKCHGARLIPHHLQTVLATHAQSRALLSSNQPQPHCSYTHYTPGALPSHLSASSTWPQGRCLGQARLAFCHEPAWSRDSA